MDLCHSEDWELSCAFTYSWLVNFKDKARSSTFKSHDGNYEWCLNLELKPKLCSRCTNTKILSIDHDMCTSCYLDYQIHEGPPPSQPDNLENYYFQVWLRTFAGKHPSILQKKKIEVSVINANSKDCGNESIKKEICIDKEHTIFSIHFSRLEETKINNEFLTSDRYLTIEVKIFDIVRKPINDFEKLLKSGQFSDFKIIMSEKEFLVHRNILANRSDYFCAMFKHETKEQIEGIVKVPDMPVEVLNKLLYFIYCGKIDTADELSYELLTAADAFQVQSLKTMCEKRIASQLNIDNLGKCIVYADAYNNAYLKQETIKFLTTAKERGCKFSDNDVANFKLTSISPSYLSLIISKFLV